MPSYCPAAAPSLRCTLTLAAFALAGTCTSALAQSSVTLFGGVDAGVRYVSNDAGSKTSLQSGNNYTTRFGLRGEEDLGGGLKAGFWLESAVNASTGVAGGMGGAQLWDRRSTLSFSGPLGEVRLGRDYTPVFRAFAATDVFNYAGAVSMVSLYNNPASTVVAQAFGSKVTAIARTNGSLQYFTPKGLGGFYLNAMVSNSGGGTTSGDYDYRGARVGYAAGPVDVTLAAGSAKIEASGKNFTIASATGVYRLPASKVKLTAGVVQMKYLNAKQVNYTAGVDWPIGPGQVVATYHRINQSGNAISGASVSANDADVLGLGYVHNLSKRTALYGTAAFFNNHGAGRFGVAGGLAGSAAGTNSRGLDLGVRHLF